MLAYLLHLVRKKEIALKCFKIYWRQSIITAKFVKYKGPDNNRFYFRLHNAAGDIILLSGGYTSALARDSAIQSVRISAGYDERYERCQTPHGKWFFNLRASNSSIVGNSQMYDTSPEMEAGINEVKSRLLMR